jgi:phage shock protein E
MVNRLVRARRERQDFDAMNDEEKRLRLERALQSVPQLDPATVDGKLAHGALVIDVRDAEAHAQSHIPGSINVERDSLAQAIASLAPDPSTPIVCYCNGGSRGPLAALALQELGYTDVGAVAGGLRAYQARSQGDDTT